MGCGWFETLRMKKRSPGKRPVREAPVKVQAKPVEAHSPGLAAANEPTAGVGAAMHDFGQVRIGAAGASSAGTSPAGAIQRKCESTPALEYYQKSPNYCKDTAFTGREHKVNENKVCFRELSLANRKKGECPPSYHICFICDPPNTKDIHWVPTDQHTDKFGSMKGKPAGPCEIEPSCGVKHYLQEALPYALPDGFGPYEKDKSGKKHLEHITLPGEDESRNTDLY